MWAVRVFTCLAAAGSLFAQHTFSLNDVEEGRRFYEANCSRCHGAEGNLIPGVDFTRGVFPRAKTDEDLIKVIRVGIPSAGMPPGTFSDFQAETIVAFVRSLTTSAVAARFAKANPAQGKAIFEGKGGCTNCHRVNGVGSRTGPDLSDIGKQRRLADQLERSILEPDAEILPQNRQVRLVLKDGSTVTGQLLNHDTFSVQILDSKEQLVSIPSANLREVQFPDKSPMPSYKGKLSSREIEDLVSYLVSLKGI